MVRWDGSRLRCLTRNGHDWADRFLVMSKPPPGEVTSDFHPLRNQRRGSEAVLFAFDLIEHDGDDLRDLPARPSEPSGATDKLHFPKTGVCAICLALSA